MVLRDASSILPSSAGLQKGIRPQPCNDPGDRFISSSDSQNRRPRIMMTAQQLSAIMPAFDAPDSDSAEPAGDGSGTPAPGAQKTATVQVSPASNLILSEGMNSLLFATSELKRCASEIVQDPAGRTIFANMMDGDRKKSALVAYDEAGVKKWEVPGGEYERYLKLVPDGSGGVIARDNSKITAYDCNGKEMWSYDQLNGDTENFDNWRQYAPVVGSDGTVYYTTARINRGRRAGVNDDNLSLVALKDGKKLWEFEAQNNVNFDPGLTITDDGKILLEAQDNDGIIFSRKHHVFCFEPGGKEVFRAKVDFRWNFGKAMPAGAPDGTIYFAQEGKTTSLTALNPDGSQKWSHDIGCSPDAPPFDAGNGKVFLPTGRNTLLCLDSRTGEEQWRKSLPGNAQSSVFTDRGKLAICGDNVIHYLDDRGNITESVAVQQKGALVKTEKDEYFAFDYHGKKLTLLDTASVEEIGKKLTERIEQEQSDKKEVLLTDDSVHIDGITLKRKGGK